MQPQPIAQPKNPSELEMQILSVLFEQGASTAREVLEKMPDGKSRAYTTILSAMQVMEKKGFLRHEKQGAAHRFMPAVSREKIINPFLNKIMRNVFSSDPALLIQALVNNGQLDEPQLDEIKKILETAREQQ